jgi:hypothetical protein
LTAIGLAYNAAIGDRSIRSATFLNTHTDFSVPGILGVFTDEATIAGLGSDGECGGMSIQGVLPQRGSPSKNGSITSYDTVLSGTSGAMHRTRWHIREGWPRCSSRKHLAFCRFRRIHE